jgi:hypothetical protein
MTEVQMKTRYDVVSGIWKLGVHISKETLIELAMEWKREEPENYLDLHIRDTGQGGQGIGFKYVFEGPNYHRWFHRMRRKLEYQFGEISWDISSPTIMLIE